MKRVKELYYDNLQTLFLNCYLSLTLYYSIFSQMVFDICFEVDTLTSIFLLRLLFDLGYRGLRFASTTNLKAGPRFADIWYPVI